MVICPFFASLVHVPLLRGIGLPAAKTIAPRLMYFQNESEKQAGRLACKPQI